MIRLAVAACLAALPAVAQTNCAAERDMMLAALGIRGTILESPGEVQERDGACVWQELSVSQNNVQADIGDIAWQLTGADALARATGRINLNVEVHGLRISPRSSDAWVNYIFREQNRRNLIDITLRASWDLGPGLVELSLLDIDLPGANHVSLDGRLVGFTPAIFSGDPAAFADNGLEGFNFSIENNGFLDGLLIGTIAGRTSEIAGDPEQIIAATKRDLTAIVQTWPEDIFPPDSKDALARLIDDGPLPWGKLDIEMTSTEPFRPARALEQSLTADLLSPEAIATFNAGLSYDIRFEKSD